MTVIKAKTKLRESKDLQEAIDTVKKEEIKRAFARVPSSLYLSFMSKLKKQDMPFQKWVINKIQEEMR